jgi:hypothetical protein
MDHRIRGETGVAGGCPTPKASNSKIFFGRSDGTQQGPRRAFTGGPGFSRRAEVETVRNSGIFSTKPAPRDIGLGALQHMTLGAVEQASPLRN